MGSAESLHTEQDGLLRGKVFTGTGGQSSGNPPYLDVVVRVPVRVVDDDGVCGGQVYAQTSGPG